MNGLSMRTISALLFLIASASLAAHAQHHAAHGGDRPHAHWHASPDAVRVAVALQPGGNVVFFRHGKTDMLATDQHPLVDMSDCSKQRNLSPSGIAASKEMGEATKLLNIPIGQVLASPYCRCMDTARHAFGRVEASQDLLVRRTEHGWALDEAGERLKKLLSVPPAPGTNTVLVAHIFNVQTTLGLTPEEGEALVFRPDGIGSYQTVGRLTATQWGDLVRDLVVFKMDPRTLEQGHGAHSRHGPHGPAERK
jgi:phosphohistidine phosphatase SixA